MNARDFQLNPFPFAGETGFRLGFLLLAASTVALTAGFHVMGAFAPSIVDVESCLVHRVAPILKTVSADLNLGGSFVMNARNQVDLCLSGLVGGSLVLWPLVFLTGFVVATAVLMAVSQYWIIRTAGLEPLPAPLCEAVHDSVRRLSAQVGNSRIPEVLWAPLDPRPGAFVLGSDRRPKLALTSGAMAAGLSDPSRLNALLAHELAHVANREITTTLLARAAVTALLAVVWPLYLALSLAEPNEPETLRAAFGGDLPSIRFMSWEIARLALISGLVLLAANSVYRARERFADLRASLVPAVRDTLREQFTGLPRPDLWTRVFSRHPSFPSRHHGLDSSKDLFALAFATPFVLTFSFSFATPIAMLTWMGVVQDWIFGSLSEGNPLIFALAFIAPVTFLAVPLSASMVPIVWRTWHASVLQGSACGSVVGPAFAAVLGSVVGIGTSVAGIVFFTPFPLPEETPKAELTQTLVILTLIFALMFVLYWLYLSWLRNVVLSWTPALVRHSSGDRQLRWLFTGTSLPIVLVVPPVLLLSLMLPFVGDIAAAQGLGSETFVPGLLGATLIVIALNPLALLVLPTVALFPLVSGFSRGQVVAGWPFIGETPRDAPPMPAVRPVTALVVGVLWGTFLIWVTTQGAWQPLMIREDLQSPIQVLFALGAMLALVALPVSIWAPGFRVEHGLLATLAASLVCVVGLFLFLGAGNLLGKWLLLSGTSLAGLILALVGAGLRCIGSSLVRTLRKPVVETW